MDSQKKLEMFEDQYGLHFSFRWKSANAYVMLFAGFATAAPTILFMLNKFASNAPPIVFLVCIFQFLIGCLIFYSALTNLFNETKIDLINDQLTIKHGPIPYFRGDQTVNVNNIKQFYVKELKKSSKNGTTFNYGVWGILKDGSRLDLTKGVNMDSDYALEVEEKLEKYLGIQDEPVKGAYGNVEKRKVEKATKKKTGKQNKAEEPLDLDELKNRPKPEIEKRNNWKDEDFV